MGGPNNGMNFKEPGYNTKTFIWRPWNR